MRLYIVYIKICSSFRHFSWYRHQIYIQFFFKETRNISLCKNMHITYNHFDVSAGRRLRKSYEVLLEIRSIQLLVFFSNFSYKFKFDLPSFMLWFLTLLLLVERNQLYDDYVSMDNFARLVNLLLIFFN